jgi:HAD superfamily hydrolase (TIGR01493 family)
MTTIKLHDIEACVFDAYGTLFDVNSAARASQDLLGEKWQTLAELWREKQLQYTWLRGLAGRHADLPSTSPCRRCVSKIQRCAHGSWTCTWFSAPTRKSPASCGA